MGTKTTQVGRCHPARIAALFKVGLEIAAAAWIGDGPINHTGRQKVMRKKRWKGRDQKRTGKSYSSAGILMSNNLIM